MAIAYKQLIVRICSREWSVTQTTPETGLTPAERQYPLPPTLLDASVYTDPDRYRAEVTAIFHHSWFSVRPSSDVPDPRDYLVWEQTGQSVVITRLDDGAVRAWHNVCQHRGARLVDGAGRCGRGRFTCPWHGFVYDLEGVVSGVPLPGTFDADVLRGLRAPAVRATEWGGGWEKPPAGWTYIGEHLEYERLPVQDE